jgi:hypothetical protein
MTDAVVPILKPSPQPAPVTIIAERLQAQAHGIEKTLQTAYAVIGALEQNGWVIVRKRHHGERP